MSRVAREAKLKRPPSKTPTERGLRIASILVSCAALALLASAFGARFYNRIVLTALLVLVLASLCAAIALHARFLLSASRAYRETVNALGDTEAQYKSVFDGALDAILILDDGGFCLDANPAALALLGASREEIVGQPAGNFFEEPDFPERVLKEKLGEARVAGRRLSPAFVECTAKAGYLPGRHLIVLRDVSERKRAEAALRESEERFREMAGNIQEIFWMLDAEKLKVLYVSPAYEAVTGRACKSLERDPASCAETIHPEDRVHVLCRFSEAARSGAFHEEFRIVRSDGTTRWVSVRGFPVRDSSGVVRRLVGTAQDISARKLAEEQMARHLDFANSAWAEAEAFRKISLALTENLSLDSVLDTILGSLAKLIAFESAQVLLVESGTRLLLAREMQSGGRGSKIPKFPPSLDASDNPLFLRVLASRTGLLVPDGLRESQCPGLPALSRLRSWLCVPLLASGEVLGMLSLGHTEALALNQEHLRLAKSLAIPAAVAIQNARLYERAEIFRSVLEERLADLERTQRELEETQAAKGSSS